MAIDSNPKGRSRQQRTDVFISYSHKDKRWLGELNTMLQPLVRMGKIKPWDDTMITSGNKWREEIYKALGLAKVAVLLVSKEFLASDFINKNELPKLLEGAERDGLTILWVAVQPSLYRLTPIAHYQAANDPERPLAALPRWKREKELVTICEKIQAAITTLVRKKSAKVRPKAGVSSTSPPRVDSEKHSRPLQYDPTDYLINFDDERSRFGKMLDGSHKKRLMFIRAPGGRGKSSLLLMLASHCEREGNPYCRIDSKGQPYDNPHFTLAHAMFKRLHFSPRHLAQALQPLSVFRWEGKIDDPYIVSQILEEVNVTNNGLRQRYIKERLREAFTADLGQLVKQKGRVVCLFDSLERLSPDEEDWLLNTLLKPIKSGKLKDVVIVTAGHRWPKIHKKNWERDTYLIDGLPSMNAEHIKTYAEKLNIKITDEEAKYYRKASAGVPLHMAILVRNLRTQSEVA
jgi:hypothetical protein